MTSGRRPDCVKWRYCCRWIWLSVVYLFCICCLVSGHIRYSIPEEMKTGSFIGNVAQDLGLDLKRLRSGRARIVTGENMQYIELKTDKGILIMKERIDREQLCGDTMPCSFSFEMILENPMELHQITIEITDINDHSPTFKKNNILFEISESATTGARFPLTSAEDADVGINGLKDYFLTENDNFMLKQHSSADGKKYAELVLQKPLDREMNPNLSLKLIAVDGGNPQRSGTVNINVIVLDNNDNAPVFNQSVYKAVVMENSPRDTYVTTVNASDADFGLNSIVTYYFSDFSGALRDLFRVDEKNGVILITGSLDYEKDKRFELQIHAKDQGGLTDSSRVIIEVADVNDNAPIISVMSFSSSVSEDSPPGTTTGIINVKDLDSGENGQVTCRIEEKSPFKIKSSLKNYYTLITESALDRENVSEYNITVVAMDAGMPSLSAKKTFNLKISDVNDNAPVFPQSVYSAFVLENNSPGVSVTMLRAKDLDENQNARITYILEEGNIAGSSISEYVSVNAESGVVHAVRSFDYEQIKQLVFVVKAQDGGSPPLSSNVTVKILIQDQNDNPPQVLYPVQTGGSLVAEMVPRSADVGYLVTKVVAVDVDSGQNAWLSYKLQKTTDRALFEVGLQNGEIRTIRQVTDKDAVKQRLTVIVEDNGQPSRSATVIVNVAVADSFPEVLSEFTEFSHDKEYNDDLTFYLVLALAVVSFLFITCVVVIISVKIYRWRQSRILYHSNLPVIPYYPPRYSDTLGTGTLPHVYNYEVCRTTDSRKSDCKFGRAGSQNVLIMDPSSTGTMQRIQNEKNILDEPDSPVEWEVGILIFLTALGERVNGHLRYSIPEEKKIGSVIGNVARDLGLDLGRLRSGRARVINGENIQYAELKTDKGILVVNERIDREELCGDVTPCSLSFDIILENPIELHRVTVEILDINDNAPFFPNTEINLETSESATIGAKYPIESAVDPDVGPNALQNYILTPNSYFVLKQHTNPDGNKYAELVLQKPLDREEHSSLTLKVMALDGGNPERSGTVNINVLVLDVNDNAPVFNQSVYRAVVVENAPKGTYITTVNATDADTGTNGEVIFSFSKIKGSTVHVFIIDEITGVISVAGLIDYEKNKKYELRLEARDRGGLTGTSKVLIDINDVNDNAPIINIMSFSSIVSEDAPLGTTIAVINVKDADSDQNGQIICALDQSLQFKIQSSVTGYYNLVANQHFDRETTGIYNITITATDLGSPPLSSSVKVHLTVSDVNDNRPLFDENMFSAYITENNLPGMLITTVNAKDSDWNQNARISYFLEDTQIGVNSVSNYVSINSETGMLHAVRSFDYEQLKEIELTVKAQDGGSPPLSSNVTVKILIQDQNDNPPQVLYPVQTGGSVVAEMVPRSADVGYLVTKVVAVDVDSGQNAWLSYKLQKTTDRALFEVGLQNGEIRTIRQVTDKDAVKQRLTVIVEDNGQPSRSATVIVNVAVADSFPEVLSEFTEFSQDKEYNDNLTFYLVLALAVVSFLFITCVVVIISVKIYRWKQSRILYHSKLPVIPYYPPRYSDTLGTGTLPHVYNYEVCRTTDSRKNDIKYMQAVSQSLLSVNGAAAEMTQEDNQLSGNSSQLSTLMACIVKRSRCQAVVVVLFLFKLSSVTGQARYTIPEEQAEGSFVGNIARDLGLDVARLVSGKARIITKGSRQYVDLSRDKGTLVIKERIDREELCGKTTPCSFSFEVILENPIQLYRVIVEIIDVNDNSPSFSKDEIDLKIAENAASGTRFSLLSADDPDVGINDVQKYILKPSDHFKLEVQNQLEGNRFVEMVLQNPLDREKEETHTLVLVASDGGEPHRSGTVCIHITVLDVNDNAPICSQPVYKADVKENSPVGTVITTVSANDVDKGVNGEITFSIPHLAKEEDQIFDVNVKTGEIKIVGKLDFEKSSIYQLNVQASDHGGFTDTCKVILQILDENDNSPTIQLMSFSNFVSEDSPPGTTIAVVNVDDADSDNNGIVKCSIDSDVPFKIESSLTGYYTIVTDSLLDRESIAEYNITITVSDQGSPPLSSSKKINVKVSDVNDSPPIFAESVYSVTVPENNVPGFWIFALSASDADSGQNARVSYFLEEKEINGVALPSLVSVNSETGAIHAIKSFDYEHIKSFHFNVTARDAGSPPQSSVASLKIMIQDQNDNPPQILYPVQTGGSVVAEMVPRSADVGYLVTKVVAVDVDSGQNAWLSYKLEKTTDRALFEVGLQNGEIRTIRQVTDKDAVKQRLTVIVEDNGQPSRSATVIVNVAVADSFPEVLSEFTDFSQDKEYNDNLTFYLVLALAVVSFLFVTCLVVIISVKIYRWRQSRILYHSNLPVIPYYPPRYSDTLGTGTLPHVYNYEVCRTTDSRKSDCKFGRAGSQNVLIMDPSSTGTMQRIKNEKNILDEPESPLEVSHPDPTMQFFCIQTMDCFREMPFISNERKMKWEVRAFFLVFLLELTNCQIRYTVPEEMRKDSFVGNVAEDLGMDAKRLKSGGARIVSGDSSQYIRLDVDKGTLVVGERIDREELCGQTSPCSLNLEMISTNPMQLFSVVVEILDVNDNAPAFHEKEMYVEIVESAVPGTEILQVSATDPDVGLNALRSYTLQPTTHFNIKVISSPNGHKYAQLYLSDALDREKEEKLLLTLTAEDGGEPQRTGTLKIHVSVRDTNDNVPVFTQSVFKASIKENTPRGTLVVSLSATDADEGMNGRVTYHFNRIPSNVANLFLLDENSGDITVNGRVDYEENKMYEIGVQAKDQGGQSTSTNVIIEVIDVNDNSPLITLTSFSHTIPEDSPIGTTVAIIHVKDMDSDKNGKVDCSVNANIPFTIHSSLKNYYTLVTKGALNRESNPEYNITFTAVDEGSPPLSTNTTIHLRVSDVNDNAPIFEQSYYVANVMENNSPGLSVFSLQAHDADSGQNARVSYLLSDTQLNGNPMSSYISVNAETGVIQAIRSFDYEQIKTIIIYVRAQDGGSPPLSSNTTVKLNILDQNDNPPQVLYPVQPGGTVVAEMVPRSADVGYLVTKVVAVDVDSGQNAWLSYKLQKTTDRALFEVGLQNGEIRTIRQVTDKDAVKQRLTVIVEDNGQPSRSATVIVNVAVADSFPEVLSEFTDFSQDKEYNDNLTFYLVLALAVVSFLFITCVVVIISVKIYRWRQTRILYHSNLPVIPYYPPRYSDTLGTGTLPHVYNYEVCRTTDSRKSDCKFGRAGSQNVLIMDPNSTATMQRIQNEKSILDEPDSPLEVRHLVNLLSLFIFAFKEFSDGHI
ncbi:protocadherin Fat 4-like [Xenentodon cancila]